MSFFLLKINDHYHNNYEGVWQHFALTMISTAVNYYVNAATAYTGTTIAIRSFTSTTTTFASSIAATATFDDVRIYSRNLAQNEVLKVLNSYY